MAKRLTTEQVKTAQKRAVLAAQNLLQDDGRADEIEAMTPEEYAESKGIEIVENPSPQINRKELRAMPTIRELRAQLREKDGIITDLEDENQELQDQIAEIRGIVASDDEEDDETEGEDENEEEEG